MATSSNTLKDPAPRPQGTFPSSTRLSPASTAALLTAAAFCVLLFVLRLGYWINDDVKIVWGLVGYPGTGAGSPFTIYTNVLVGLLLAPLYGSQASVNWFILLQVLLNAVCTFALLWLVLACRRGTFLSILGCAAILIGVAALTINLTYTLTALLACATGLLLLWASARSTDTHWRVLALFGCSLIVAGGLLRLQMLPLGVFLASPIIIASSPSVNLRRLATVSFAAALLVLLAAGFDRLYVRASSDWNAFYAYTRVRQQLHDSHRLNNVHTEIRRIGWTAIDQELFAHWFYPDEQLYSFEKLHYLVERVPPESQDPWGSFAQFARQLSLTQHAPYLLWMVAVVAGALAVGSSVRHILAVFLTWAAALSVNLVLTVIYKDPDYVLAGSLAASLAITIVYLLSSGIDPRGRTVSPPGRYPVTTFLFQLSFVTLVLGGIALLGNLIAASSINNARQRDYARFRSDLEALQREGILASDALIVSPAHGLPYEWSYPLTVDRPIPPYFDTGWITFSPPYQRLLDEYGITSLPEALVSRNNLYLMAESSFTPFLARYYEERGGRSAKFQALYEMPVSEGLLGNDPILLYKLSANP